MSLYVKEILQWENIIKSFETLVLLSVTYVLKRGGRGGVNFFACRSQIFTRVTQGFMGHISKMAAVLCGRVVDSLPVKIVSEIFSYQ